jgi:hypothetical protein
VLRANLEADFSVITKGRFLAQQNGGYDLDIVNIPLLVGIRASTACSAVLEFSASDIICLTVSISTHAVLLIRFSLLFLF